MKYIYKHAQHTMQKNLSAFDTYWNISQDYSIGIIFNCTNAWIVNQYRIKLNFTLRVVNAFTIKRCLYFCSNITMTNPLKMDAKRIINAQFVTKPFLNTNYLHFI